MKTIAMSAGGRLTIPSELRKALCIEGEATFQAELDAEGYSIVLKQMVFVPKSGTVPREDAWAYAPEALAALERALEDSRQGRVRRMSEEDLIALAPGES
ncbi:MAG: hypothetical protein ACR2HN_13230 [Tepidiformaceae bacterium]